MRREWIVVVHRCHEANNRFDIIACVTAEHFVPDDQDCFHIAFASYIRASKETAMTQNGPWAILVLACLSSACVTKPTTESGFLSDYSRLSAPTQEGAANVRAFADAEKLAGVTRVVIAPSALKLPEDAGFADGALAPLLSEMDRQLCRELAERFEIAKDDPAALHVRAAITGVTRTGAASSVISAAASRAIPGPGSIRLPVGLGGLAAEMEARVGAAGPLAAELSWSRRAQLVLDQGSVSAIGDAHQMIEPFADKVGALLTPPDLQSPRAIGDQCPGITAGDVGRGIAGRALGLYVPPGSEPPKQPSETQTSPQPQSE